MRYMTLILALVLTFAVATPAVAQESPMRGNDGFFAMLFDHLDSFIDLFSKDGEDDDDEGTGPMQGSSNGSDDDGTEPTDEAGHLLEPNG